MYVNRICVCKYDDCNEIWHIFDMTFFYIVAYLLLDNTNILMLVLLRFVETLDKTICCAILS